MKERIIKKLSENLNIKHLQVINQSHLHKGHLGDDGSGETHFEITILADDFKNISRVLVHRKINGLLKEEFNRGLHALSIKTDRIHTP